MTDTGFALSDTLKRLPAEWLAELSAIRRPSPKTVEAYTRDLDQLMAFLSGHIGGTVDLPDLKTLRPADLRAFLAARHRDGVGSSSLARGLSGIKSFFAHLERNVRPVRFEPGRLEINPSEHAPRNLSGNLAALLTKWTGRRWICAISSEAGEPSLAERRAAAKERSLAAAEAHPLVKAVRAQFPGAEIAAVRDRNEDLPLPVDTQSQGDDDA